MKAGCRTDDFARLRRRYWQGCRAPSRPRYVPVVGSKEWKRWAQLVLPSLLPEPTTCPVPLYCATPLCEAAFGVGAKPPSFIARPLCCADAGNTINALLSASAVTGRIIRRRMTFTPCLFGCSHRAVRAFLSSANASGACRSVARRKAAPRAVRKLGQREGRVLGGRARPFAAPATRQLATASDLTAGSAAVQSNNR